MAVIVLALGTIQMVSTVHTYMLNVAQLNALHRQEAALVAQKQELDNQIARWDDRAYVTAQARERLGFVFPGEQAVRVEHPEAVTGESGRSTGQVQASRSAQALPWYQEIGYAFQQAERIPLGDKQAGEVPRPRATADRR